MSNTCSKQPCISCARDNDGNFHTAHAVANDNQEDNTHDLITAIPAHVGNRKRVSRQNRNIFRFGDLPGELRNRIYHLCLAADATIYLTLWYDKIERHRVRQSHDYLGANPVLLIPNLLRVNKAIYAEGGPILYANKFHFHESKCLFVFFANMSVTAKSWVQELTLKLKDPDEHWGLSDEGLCAHGDHAPGAGILLPAFTTLIEAPNLKQLHLHLYLSVGESRRWRLDTVATTLFSLSHLWLEARTRQKGSREEAVKPIDFEIVVEDISECTNSESESSRDDYDKDWTTSELRKELVQKLCFE